MFGGPVLGGEWWQPVPLMNGDECKHRLRPFPGGICLQGRDTGLVSGSENPRGGNSYPLRLFLPGEFRVDRSLAAYN